MEDDDTETDSNWIPIGDAVQSVLRKLSRCSDLASLPSPTPSNDHSPRPYERGGDANDECGDDSDNEEPIHAQTSSIALCGLLRMRSNISMEVLRSMTGRKLGEPSDRNPPKAGSSNPSEH
jgi:hypothetical protein